MGNSILPVTKEYSESILDFNEASLNEADETTNKNQENKENQDNKYNILEKRVEQIEATTLSNLTLISEDIHHLFELYNKIKLVVNAEPPVII